MPQRPTAIGSYRFHTDTEAAVKDLRRAGIDTAQMSIIGKDQHGEDGAVGIYGVGNTLSFWGKLGTFWASLSGALVGAGLFVIPGVGHIFAMGPVVAALVVALDGTAASDGAGIVTSALLAVGVPDQSLATYSNRIAAGEIVLIVHGAPEQLQKADDILQRTGASADNART